MVADPEIVRDRETHIRRYVDDLREFGRMAEADFLANRERQYAVLHALQLAIEASVEIATHICAADNLGAPASYAEAFDLIEQAGIIDSPLAEDLRAWRGSAIGSCIFTAGWTCASCSVSYRNASAILTSILPRSRRILRDRLDAKLKTHHSGGHHDDCGHGRLVVTCGHGAHAGPKRHVDVG